MITQAPRWYKAKNTGPGTRSPLEIALGTGGGRDGTSAAEGAGLTLQSRCCWWLYCPRASSRGPHSSLVLIPAPHRPGTIEVEAVAATAPAVMHDAFEPSADPRKAASADHCPWLLGWDEGPGGVNAGAAETFHEARKVAGLWLCGLWSGVLQEGPRMREPGSVDEGGGAVWAISGDTGILGMFTCPCSR